MEPETVIYYDTPQPVGACRFCLRREPEVRLGYSKFRNAIICGQRDCAEVAKAREAK